MPDTSPPLRLSPTIAGIIGALAGLVSCDVVSSTLTTADLWPGPVAGSLIGFIAYKAVTSVPLTGALGEFARHENASRHRGGLPWRAAMIAWLVCIVAGGAVGIDFKMTDILTHHANDNPTVDLGLGVGFAFGIPIALGVLLLGYRRRELLPAPPTSALSRPAVSLELAAGIGALAGFVSCYLTLPFLSMWFAPPLGIVVALVAFKLVAMARADEELVASSVAEVLPDSYQEYQPAISRGELPWALAGLAWIACAVLGGLYVYGLRALAPTHDLLSFLADGLLAGGALGVPVAVAILWLGRRRRT